MVTFTFVPGRHSPLYNLGNADVNSLNRTQEVLKRWRARREELGLSQGDLARLMSVDRRTVIDIEDQNRPRVLQATQKQVSRIEAGEVNVSGSSGGRGLLVGLGAELILVAEKAMDAGQGAFTKDLYWRSDGGTLEDRIRWEPGIDKAAKEMLLTVLEAARLRGPSR